MTMLEGQCRISEPSKFEVSCLHAYSRDISWPAGCIYRAGYRRLGPANPLVRRLTKMFLYEPAVEHLREEDIKGRDLLTKARVNDVLLGFWYNTKGH